MNWFDQPAATPAPTTSEPRRPAFSGPRRLVATTVLAVGLLGVGGAAVVFAADPSGSPAPSATVPSDSGGATDHGNWTTRPQRQGPHGGAPMGAAPNGAAPNGASHRTGDCPDMGGSDGSDGSRDAAPNGSATPSTDGTSTPSTSDL
jgi:hypothetical protein